MQKIAPAFIAAKREFAPLLKDKTNPAFRSKYADLGACIDAVEAALLKQDIAVFHETSEDQTGITVECVLLHASGEMIRGGKLHVPAAKQDPQGYGSALTYARRYSLTAICGIAPEDDDGNAAAKAAQKAAEAERLQQRAEWLEEQAMKLESCETMSELGDVWKAAFKIMKAKNDDDAIATLEPVKDRMKATIEAATA